MLITKKGRIHNTSRLGISSANRGFTLVELMIVVVVIAISIAIAIPSWRTSVEKRHVVAGAEQIASFISLARGEAMKRGQEVTVSWHSNGGHSENWCIGLKLGDDACDCMETTTTDSDFCEIDGAPQRLTQSDFVDMDYEFFYASDNDSSFSFDPVRGLVTNNEANLFTNSYMYYLQNDMKVGGKRLYELQVRINRTGRINICANDDRQSMIGGYPEC